MQKLDKRVDAALAAVNMTEYREHGPHLLSGGQKQRIAIAGVLAMKPDCIVLDEPTAMLDPKGRREVLETVHKLNKEEGITIVYITHFMEEAVTADRVVVMKNGVKLHDGTPREIFSHVDTLKGLGLDVPVASEIAFKLNAKGYEVGKSIINNEELAEGLKGSKLGKQFIRYTLNRCFKRGGNPLMAIVLDNITYTYGMGTPFEKTALRGVSLTIENGEFLGVIGHTGSGKSTFVQHLNGLLHPTTGTVTVNGVDISASTEEAKKIAS